MDEDEDEVKSARPAIAIHLTLALNLGSFAERTIMKLLVVGSTT